MKPNGKIIVGIFTMMLFGVGLVGASSYYSMNELHEKMMVSGDFEKMHTAMMNGDFKAAAEYHQTLDFECPMHELVKEGEVTLGDFQVMHGWMMTGDFPAEKPMDLSDAAWDLHKTHHPELYR